jgi:hypothetical protein
MTYVYRIAVEYPDAWDGTFPDAVQDAVDMFPDAYLHECTEHSRAVRAVEFWERMGAVADLKRSNPVTWSAGAA